MGWGGGGGGGTTCIEEIHKVRRGNLERSLSLAPHTRTGAVMQGYLITKR